MTGATAVRDAAFCAGGSGLVRQGLVCAAPDVTTAGHDLDADDVRHQCDVLRLVATEEVQHDRVAGEDFTRHPAKHAGTAPDEDGEAFKQGKDDGAAGDDDRDTDHETKRQQDIVALGYRGHGDDVVQAHDDVGDDNDAHRAPQIFDSLRRI